MYRLFILLFIISSGINTASGQQLKVPGLRQSVEIIRDQYGINHIYAQNEYDLFFSQGYCAAKDRLFQFEIWRRQATGTTAEILGQRELNRDIGARLFKFRGDLTSEYNHYHPRGEEIILAFTDGINACIREALADKSRLPLEFKLMGIKPGFWTPDVVISRHQGLLLNIEAELNTARSVAILGEEKVVELGIYGPGDPCLAMDPCINQDRLSDDIIAPYTAFRTPLRLTPEDLLSSANSESDYKRLSLTDQEAHESLINMSYALTGSNNWVVGSELSQSGFPLLANDPHRTIMVPSLRYIVHLNAPGWSVTGGGEPTIPGVSIGHNDHGAWGLTHYVIDKEDLYVYKLNPLNQNQYEYQGRWEDMRMIVDTIKVKNLPDAIVEHRYTRHGPVTFLDKKNNIAYSIRCAWLETGCAPYLASLRIDQAKSMNEFRDACQFSHLPGLNFIWADRYGNIGWQVAGIAPIRKNWSGLVPVPGDGRYEWSGFLPVLSLPNQYNPAKGFWATANENLAPFNYLHNNAIGLTWADTYRADRINEVLATGSRHSLAGMMRLQFDYLSIPARTLIPYLKDLNSDNARTETARKLLLAWNYILDKSSVEAAIYVEWENKISENIIPLFVPEKGRSLYKTIPLRKIIEWIASVRPEFGTSAFEGRDKFLLNCLQQAVDDLTKKLGPDMKNWIYGQPAYHYVLIKHPLSNAVDKATRSKLDLGPLPRGGNSSTPGMTGNTGNQTSGASFRMVVDTKDWDLTMFTNTPGQSGDPESQFYSNLFDQWARDQHFPGYFSRRMIEKIAFEKMLLIP
ncbi:MAG: peptidase S45 [Bacteroidetes bacterium GWE2_41_25]|nr:MAG: peptidase S45 [Bacteroidetes bacterium GWA2_40_15]OFX99848.1 MAG: peptidase S45 [Bacteroidetes bacterium GWE2_41_25]HBH82547.1 penicillin acylase family protein [Bacteroidales bacterium]HBQ84127.1 penicillin acylase family protein [Bacteroidales bacterium]HCU17692.1 penicillin acylase family protein [Bacteroidales bacterium]